MMMISTNYNIKTTPCTIIPSQPILRDNNTFSHIENVLIKINTMHAQVASVIVYNIYIYELFQRPGAISLQCKELCTDFRQQHIHYTIPIIIHPSNVHQWTTTPRTIKCNWNLPPYIGFAAISQHTRSSLICWICCERHISTCYSYTLHNTYTVHNMLLAK